MTDTQLQLESLAVGPLPIVNHFLRRLRLEELLDRAAPHDDRRRKLSPGQVLGAFVRNLLLSRYPLYEIPSWASRYVPDLLGLTPDEVGLLNDDRIGRCLDLLFEADRASLLTSFVVSMVEEFDLRLKVLHNDSTTVSFTGQYPRRLRRRGPPPLRITHGYSKDHRPDLKQLLFELSVTEDGAVPVWVGLHDGNVSDSQTHLGTWRVLREIIGRPDFVYVADSKLCVTHTMTTIASEGGRFVSMLTPSRKEERWFKEHIRTHRIPWKEVWRRPPLRRRDDPPDLLQGYESPLRSAEGYRILWYHSSVKQDLDQRLRQGRIDRAVEQLAGLATRLGTRRLKTAEQVEGAATKILLRTRAERWVEVTVELDQAVVLRQVTRGRPGPNTTYRREVRHKPVLRWTLRSETIASDAKTDGLFPLITNVQDAPLRQILLWYKYQPRLEKRFEQLKTVLRIRPVCLKKVERVEAYLFLYFLAVVVEALIERQLRRGMKKERIRELPLYPEKRLCRAPTAERVLDLFADVRRHRLLEEGKEVRRFQEPLSRLQRKVLRLMRIPTNKYNV
jgi:transposase